MVVCERGWVAKPSFPNPRAADALLARMRHHHYRHLVYWLSDTRTPSNAAPLLVQPVYIHIHKQTIVARRFCFVAQTMWNDQRHATDRLLAADV